MLKGVVREHVLRALVASIASGDASIVRQIDRHSNPVNGEPRMLVSLRVPMRQSVGSGRLPSINDPMTVEQMWLYDAAGSAAPIRLLSDPVMIGAWSDAPRASRQTSLRTMLALASLGGAVLVVRASRTIITFAISVVEAGLSALRHHCVLCALDVVRQRLCSKRGERP